MFRLRDGTAARTEKTFVFDRIGSYKAHRHHTRRHSRKPERSKLIS